MQVGISNALVPLGHDQAWQTKEGEEKQFVSYSNTGLFVSIKLEESFVFYFELAFSIN